MTIGQLGGKQGGGFGVGLDFRPRGDWPQSVEQCRQLAGVRGQNRALGVLREVDHRQRSGIDHGNRSRRKLGQNVEHFWGICLMVSRDSRPEHPNIGPAQPEHSLWANLKHQLPHPLRA